MTPRPTDPVYFDQQPPLTSAASNEFGRKLFELLKEFPGVELRVGVPLFHTESEVYDLELWTKAEHEDDVKFVGSVAYNLRVGSGGTLQPS